MAEKKYVGNGKAINGKFGQIFNISIKVEDLLKLEQNKGYVRLTMSELKSPDKFGNTHTIYKNDYKPQAKEETTQEQIINQDFEELPF